MNCSQEYIEIIGALDLSFLEEWLKEVREQRFPCSESKHTPGLHFFDRQIYKRHYVENSHDKKYEKKHLNDDDNKLG